MNERSEDTRKLLKVFGVAVTEFEDACSELIERVEEGDGSDEALSTLKELIELVAEVNEKWQLVTERLFNTQRNLLHTITQALPE